MTNNKNYYGVNNNVNSSSSSSNNAVAAEESYSEEHSRNVSTYFLLFATLLSTVLILCKKLHTSPRVNAIVSEAALVLLVGMFASYCIMFYFLIRERNNDDDASNNNYDGSEEELSPRNKSVNLLLQLVSFEPNVFFMGLLPPVLFNAGYQLQRELFYRHIAPISIFAVLGTCLSAIATAFFLYLVIRLGMMGSSFQPTIMELLTFGSLIAATDTVSTLSVFQAKKVDPHIFYLVFGESALNDAVALVLYHSFANCLTTPPEEAPSMIQQVREFFLSFTYEAIGSPILGILTAFCSARIFKYVDLREHKVLELSLFLLLMYTPFIIAEKIHLSGIVTIFFTGMSARRYCAPNVSSETQKSSKAIFRLTAFLAETCIFLELGLSLSGLSGGFHWGFILWAFVATMVGRAVAIYPISFYYNWSLGENVCVATQHCHADMVIVDIDAITNALYNDNKTTEGTAGDESDSSPDDLTIESSSSRVSSSSANASSPWSIRRQTPEKRKDKEIPIKFMHVLWFSGLRGAVAYACARRFPDVNGNRDEFLGTTAVIVVFSIIVMGGAMGPLLQFLGIRTGVSEEEYMEKWHKERALKGPFHRFGT
jgi:NhaP-type Na+/H+ or K+/H+ antiporter